MQELKLPKDQSDTLSLFIKSLRDIYWNDLVSVTLYGSAASGEFIDSRSNLNVLVVLRSTDLESLKKASPLVNRSKFRRIKPLFLTQDYIEKSIDVFPIEFLDMKENYQVLFGNDCLNDLNIDIKNLKYQCEHELKANLLNLKQDFLKINQKDRNALNNLLFRYFTSVVHILRNVVRLKGAVPSYAKDAVIREIGGELHLDVTTLSNILSAKNSPLPPNLKEARALLGSFIAELEMITRLLDQIYEGL